MHKPPAIFIHAAHLRYGKQILFNNFHCTLAAGKTTCLLGPSGIGKSSLLRLIAGFDIPYASANITTDDHQSLKHRIAYMAQTDLLLPWLNVLDNVLLGFKLRGWMNNNKGRAPLAPTKDAAENLLIKIGLGDALNKFPSELSGGMRQRVALARTLIEDKPVILMDEPFSALDTVTRLRLQELAAELLINKTVLLVTHDPFEALRLGHHILVMTGKPAQIENLELPGSPPRPLTDPEVLHWQGELMKLLVTTS